MAVVVTVDGGTPAAVPTVAVVVACAVVDETEDGAGAVMVVGSSTRFIGIEELDLGVERPVFGAPVFGAAAAVDDAGCCGATFADGVGKDGVGILASVKVGGATSRLFDLQRVD